MKPLLVSHDINFFKKDLKRRLELVRKALTGFLVGQLISSADINAFPHRNLRVAGSETGIHHGWILWNEKIVLGKGA